MYAPLHLYMYSYMHLYVCPTSFLYILIHASICMPHIMYRQLQIGWHSILRLFLKNFQFSTRRTRILMGFIIYYLILIVNPMGKILVCWKSFRINLEMLCHPICSWLYTYSYMPLYICPTSFAYILIHAFIYMPYIIHAFIYMPYIIYAFVYGVASLSRIDKMIGLFCKRDL